MDSTSPLIVSFVGSQVKDTVSVALWGTLWYTKNYSLGFSSPCHTERHRAAHFPLDILASSAIKCHLSKMTPDLKF